MFARHAREPANGSYRVFVACLVVMLLHLWEDAFVHKENGSSLAAQFGSAALALLLVVVGAALYPLLWRGVWRVVRAVGVALYGLLALVAGWNAHVSDVLAGDASGGDYTGVLYALAGLVLLGLAAMLALEIVRGRPAPARS